MGSAEFVYTIHVRATPEEIWKGLLDPEFTRQYWFHENVSDWRAGSEWRHVRTDEENTIDLIGRVLESHPPRRLVLSWAKPDAEEKDVSKVTFELEPNDWPNGPWTRLRVSHTDLEAGSEMHEGISWGWPAVLSGLKTLLETGKV